MVLFGSGIFSIISPGASTNRYVDAGQSLTRFYNYGKIKLRKHNVYFYGSYAGQVITLFFACFLLLVSGRAVKARPISTLLGQ